MAADNSYLLTLPMEMLQRISGFVTTDDLIALRLTCKRLSAATFDNFAAEYLHKLSCFVLDPARLTRIYNITSFPHLAGKVKRITLTADALELSHPSTLQAVEMYREAIRVSQSRNYVQYRDEQYLHHSGKFLDLTSLLRALHSLDCSRTELCLDFCFRRHSGVRGERSHVFNVLLANVARSGFPIARLALDADSSLFVDRIVNRKKGVLHATKHLQKFRYSSRMQSPTPEQHEFSLNGLSPILASAKQLKSLKLIIPPLLFGEEYVARTSLCTGLLSSTRSTCLGTLVLDEVRLSDFEALFEAFRRSRNAMRNADLHKICVESRVDRWAGVVSYLRTMPNLQKLQLTSPCLVMDNNELQVCMLDPTNPESTSMVDLCEQGREKIDAALAELLDCGLVLKEYEDPYEMDDDEYIGDDT